MNFVYPEVISALDPDSSLLNTFLFSLDQNALKTDFLYENPNNYIEECSNCGVIFTDKTFDDNSNKCALCGCPVQSTHFPSGHPVKSDQLKKMNPSQFSIFMNEKDIEANKEVLLVVLLDTSASMISSYKKEGSLGPIYQYVSRLEICLDALKLALSKLNQNKFRYRVCLITFSQNVTVYGDLSIDPIKIPYSKNFDKFETCFDLPSMCNPKDLCTHDLSFFLQELKTNPIFNQNHEKLLESTTCLGVSLAVALGVIAGHKNIDNSHVIVFTDNYSNSGFFSFDDLYDLEKNKNQNPDCDFRTIIKETKEYLCKSAEIIFKKACSLKTTFSFFGFEEVIAMEFLAKLVISPDDFYKAKLLKENNKGDKTLDLNEFYQKVEKSVSRFEGLLGFNAVLKIYISPNLSIINRDLTIPESNITPGQDVMIFIKEIGHLWPIDLSYSFSLNNEVSNQKDSLFHFELFFDEATFAHNKLFKRRKIVIWEKYVDLLEKGGLDVGKANLEILENCFRLQNMYNDDKQVENMLIFLFESKRKGKAISFREEAEIMGRKSLSGDGIYINKAEERTKERQSIYNNEKKQFQMKKDSLIPIGINSDSKILTSSTIKSSNSSFMIAELNEEVEEEGTILSRMNILNYKKKI